MSMWFSNLGKHLLGKNGWSRVLNPPLHSATGDRGAFNLFGHIWTRHQFVSVVPSCPHALHLPFSWVPPGEPESHHWERGCHLGEEESKGGQSPSSAAAHQVLRPGVRLILLSRSRQTSPAVAAGWLSWCFIVVSLQGSLLLVAHPELRAGLSHLPQGGAPASWLQAEQELSLQELFSALPYASTEPQLFQLASHQGLILKQLCPSSCFPPPLPQQSPVPVPAPCTSTQDREGFPRLLICHRRTCEPFLGLAAELGLTQCPYQVFLILLLASAWLQILLLLLSVSVHSLCKWMWTSACLCLKSTFPSLTITGWSSNTWFSCILVFQKQTINKVSLLNCDFKPVTSKAWFRIVIGPARKFLECQKKCRFPIKYFHLSRDQSCRKFSGHPYTCWLHHYSWCVDQQCLPPGLVRPIPCYSELWQIWFFNQSRDLEVLEITLYNVSAGISDYLSNKRKEGGGQRERKGRRWRK